MVGFAVSALALKCRADKVDVVDLDSLSPDLQASLETEGDLFRLGAAVSALLEPLLGSAVDLGAGHTLVLAREPHPGGRYGLCLTPGIEGVYAWQSSPRPPGPGRGIHLYPQNPDLGFAGTDRKRADAMYLHLMAVGMPSISAEVKARAAAWWDPDNPPDWLSAGARAYWEAIDLAAAWNATLGRDAAERTLRALLCLYTIAERHVEGPVVGGLAEGEGEALRQGHRTHAQRTQAASLLLLAVSNLREDAWQVARALLPDFTGTPGDLVAIASAATQARTR